MNVPYMNTQKKFFADFDFVLLYVEYSSGPIKFAGAGLRSFA
jgi:hypothetical protein